MPNVRRSYVEHVAILVRDIDWHVRFFQQVFGMTIRTEMTAQAGKARQVWTVGGIQFVTDPAFAGPEGRLAHLGIMADDQQAILADAESWGVRTRPEGPNWLALPDGLIVEVIQASPGSVDAALAVDPRR